MVNAESQVVGYRYTLELSEFENARTSTGLGLSIARTLAERMNGDISATYSNKKLTITINFNYVH